jgi:hypothetical protein
MKNREIMILGIYFATLENSEILNFVLLKQRNDFQGCIWKQAKTGII